MAKKIIPVSAAIICSPKHRILFAQRKSTDPYVPLLWEFPGGKMESGESPEEALSREIQEEFDLKINVEKAFLEVMHEYEFAKIHLHSFLCSSQSETVQCNDHESFLWWEKKKAQNLNFAPADIPIFKALFSTNWP